MAVSNSTDAKSVGATLVSDARALLGIAADEESLESFELERGLRFLTRMLKAWEGDGIGGWVYTEGTLTLVQADVDYVCGAGGSFVTVPFEITDMRIYRGSNDLPMTRIGRQQYQALSNKTTQGYPTQWFYDRQRDNGTIYVWPAPDVTAGTLKFTYRRRIMDMDTGVDDYDLPPEWEQAIVENLADKLAGVYGKADSAEAKKVAREAQISYAIVKNWDVASDDGSISIEPDGYRR